MSVRQRLGNDLSVDRLPDLPLLNKTCTKGLTPAQIEAVGWAHDAILLFTRFAVLVDDDNPALRGMVLQLWDETGIWKWMIFLYNANADLNETIGNKRRPFPMTAAEMKSPIATLLLACTDAPSLLKRMAAVPDVVSLTGMLWMEYSLEFPGVIHDGLISTIQHMLELKTAQSVLSTLLDAVGGAKIFMQVAVDRFRRLTSSKPLVKEDITPQLRFIAFLVQKFNPILGEVMHAVDAISVAIPAADSLIEQVEGPSHVGTCIQTMILPHLIAATSHQPLIRAINQGLLRTLYEARLTFLQPDESHRQIKETTQFIVNELVAPCLVLRTVLHAVERSGLLADYAKIRREDGMAELLPEWEALYALFVDIFAAKQMVDAVIKYFCGHPECAREDKLKRCARCESVKYCSRVCQQRDWPRHRRDCRKGEILGLESLYPVSDRQFDGKLASLQVRMQQRSLRQRIRVDPKLAAAAAAADVVLTVDFSNVEHNIIIDVVESSIPCVAVAVFAIVKSGSEIFTLLAGEVLLTELLKE
ncbi:hypothetical protein FB45DRAFT_185282 [Roridomyces roridus]|uniref:MYND-type domain-containing protein n=1 Tax=Roridomyces roridus TaxID=1738132 RepID=A0AAD7CEH1_9AGAR|nr:hypothetical protein FB45DRAFT_185282 [Roridomyces roridus]